MVVPASTEFSRALTDPLDVIQEVFVKEGQQDNFTRIVHDHFNALFPTEETRSKVPFLTSSLIEQEQRQDSSSSKLVRWRCMVQDTSLGNEVLSRQFRTQDGTAYNGLFGASSKLSIAATAIAPDNSSGGGFSSLTTLAGVSPPGQTPWARKIDEDVYEETSAAAPCSLHDKLPRGQGLAVLLKVYDEHLAESLQVAQIVDVLGILDRSPLPSADWTQMGSSGGADEGETGEASKLHTSLHVISFANSELATAALIPSRAKTNDAAQMRQKIIDMLAEHALAGDALAAQWILLALIARVHTRTAAHTLGSLSLNISNFPSADPSASRSSLYHTLASLLPLVADQSLDLAHLNAASTRFLPRSEADERGLRAGRLQLVPGTLLFIDERTMNEGQLKENGIENVRALSEVLTTHKLAYAFPFSSHEMDIDLPCIIVSQGKSFLPVDVHVPLQSSAASTHSVAATQADVMTEDGWADLRHYLADVQHRTIKTTAFTIPSEISERIQDDFVNTRKSLQEQSNLASSSDVLGTPSPVVPLMESQDDLNRIIQVARLVCLSNGRNTLLWHDWQEAKRLDEERLRRLANVS